MSDTKMQFGKGFCVVFEMSTPCKWVPKYEVDEDTYMYRVTWLLFGIALIPVGYVEHRCALLEQAWKKGYEFAEYQAGEDDEIDEVLRDG